MACGGEPAPSPVSPPNEPAPEASLRLYVFDCGRLTIASLEHLERFSIESNEPDVRELIVPCYVVEHPDGRMLWDGGLPSSFTTPPSHRPYAKIDRLLTHAPY